MMAAKGLVERKQMQQKISLQPNLNPNRSPNPNTKLTLT